GPVFTAIPTSPRPVPADRTEQYERSDVDSTADATQALPRIPATTKPSRPAAASLAAPLSAIDDESTQALPVSVRRPAGPGAAPDPAERTEIDMRRRGIPDMPRDAPAIGKQPAAFDDEMTIIGPPLRVALPPVPEATMLLPKTGEHPIARMDPDASVDPDRQSPAVSTDPTTHRSSAQLQRILIAINICVALVLIAIAWATL
ncbi:MAG TPA: hypothetical protein VGB85_25695, partial [Nannocystis sp.]